MSFIDTMKSKSALRSIAEKEGKSLAEIEAAIQESIDAAWENPECRALQNLYFPNGKPTPEEFITVMARYVKDNKRR